jgi:hypothetical protein
MAVAAVERDVRQPDRVGWRAGRKRPPTLRPKRAWRLATHAVPEIAARLRTLGLTSLRMLARR